MASQLLTPLESWLQMIKTKDGHTLEQGRCVTLYLGYVSMSGVPAHFGADGWQLYIGGPLIKDLYYNRVNALQALYDQQAKEIVSLANEIKEEHLRVRNNKST